MSGFFFLLLFYFPQQMHQICYTFLKVLPLWSMRILSHHTRVSVHMLEPHPSGKVTGSMGQKRKWLGVNPLLWFSLLVLLHSQAFRCPWSLLQTSTIVNVVGKVICYFKWLYLTSVIVVWYINGAFGKENSSVSLHTISQRLDKKNNCGKLKCANLF